LTWFVAAQAPLPLGTVLPHIGHTMVMGNSFEFGLRPPIMRFLFISTYSERTHHKEDSRKRNICIGARTDGNICIGARMFTYNAHVITYVLGARCYRRHSLKFYSHWSGLLRRWYGRGGPISPSCPSVR
jgi:hypothetical protein